MSDPSHQNIRVVPAWTGTAWALLAASAVVLSIAAFSIARVSLNACGFQGLGIAYSNCPAPEERVPRPPNDEAAQLAALESEGEQLERQWQQARAAVSRIAQCPVPPPPPERRAEVPPPPPLPPPPPPPEPVQTPNEALRIPTKVSDLKGCWQSIRGDIQLVSNDAARRPTRKVRVCYCFGDDGKGKISHAYTDGAACSGPISADVTGTSLAIHQPEFNCGTQFGQPSGHVRAEIRCQADNGQAAACDAEAFGHTRVVTKNERFRRVAPETCQSTN